VSAGRQRSQALRAIVAGAKHRTGGHGFVDVDQELQELAGVRNVRPEKRRHLLEVLHGMRSLETALKEVVTSHGLTPQRSIGSILHQLAQLPPAHVSHLDNRSFSRFMNTVRVDRNRFMHQANVFPRTAREVNRILGEIAACFSLLVR
jgi:hypothetical protein